MDAFEVLGEVLADYQSFVQGFLDIREGRVRAKVTQEIDNGLHGTAPSRPGPGYGH